MSAESSIERRVEQAIEGYLEGNGTFTGATVVQAGEVTDGVTVPVIIVRAEDSTADPTLQINSGIRRVSLQVEVVANAHDTTRTTLDTWMQEAARLLHGVSTLKTELNAGTATIGSLHIYDVIEAGGGVQRADDVITGVLSYEVVAGGHSSA